MGKEHTPIIGITESAAVAEETKKICLNYMRLMLKCAEDENFKETVMKYPHYYLNVEVGMKIPDSVGIIFDAGKDAGRSPAVCVAAADGDMYQIKEGFHTVNLVADLVDGNVELDEDAQEVGLKEVDICLPEPLKGSKVVVKLPFFDLRSDMITDVKFEDGAEIILTCA